MQPITTYQKTALTEQDKDTTVIDRMSPAESLETRNKWQILRDALLIFNQTSQGLMMMRK